MANCITNNCYGYVNENIQFNDQSTNTPTSWTWSFGDSTTSTLQNPTHSYITAGSYSLAHTSTNPCGTGTAPSRTIFITVPPDTISPTVTINQEASQPDPTNNPIINYTVIFSESVTGFTNGDVILSGTANATTAIVTGSGTTYNVAVSGMMSNGTVIATIGPNVAQDAAGNGNLASTSTDNIVTYTTTPPPSVQAGIPLEYIALGIIGLGAIGYTYYSQQPKPKGK